MGLLDSVTTEAPQLPSRVVLYAPEKFGKTSFGCHAPSPIFLMTAGETGLLSLIESGQVPPTPHFPADFKTWDELVEAARAILRERHDYRTLVLDTGNGAEQMLMAHVCEREFEGKWGDFNSYGRGMAAAIPVWADFLKLLDEVRVRRKMAVLFLHHSKVKAFQNPAGKDWDQWRPEAVDKLWSLTHKWADVITFFGSKVSVYDDKAKGEEARYLRCNASAAIVAGNRYGMPDEITAPRGAKPLWDAFAAALQKAKAKARQQQAQPQKQPEQASPPPPAPQPEHPAGDPDPEPADGRAPAPPEPPPPAKIGAKIIEEILTTAHAIGPGWSWPEVRAKYAKELGYTPDPKMHVSELNAEQALKLLSLLREEKAKADARKRAPKKKPAEVEEFEEVPA